MPVCGSLDIMDSGGKYHLNGPTIMPVGHVGADGEGTEGVEDHPQFQTKGVQVQRVGGRLGLLQVPKVNPCP